MYTDYLLNFGLPDITNSTTKTVSPNIFDAGGDRVSFGAGPGELGVVWKTVITADASPTILIEMVGSDNADLDPNENESVRNIVLGSSGIVRTTRDGTTIVSGEVVYGGFPLLPQWVARQFYGILTTLGGTNPDIVAATSWAYVVRDWQNHLENVRAAVPA
jgi:hypothetical protein